MANTRRAKTTPLETPTRPRGRPRKVPSIEPPSVAGPSQAEINQLASQQLAQEALATSDDYPISREEATEELPIIYGTADGILNVLQLEKGPLDLHSVLADPKSRLNRKFNTNSSALHSEKVSFTHDGATFLDSPRLGEYLMGPNNTGLVEAIAEKINLAIFALELRDWYKLAKKIPEEALRTLDDIFPTPFVTSFVRDGRVGSSRLFEVTFKLALELRTQIAIHVITTPGSEHDEVGSFFMEDEPEQDGNSRVTLIECGGKVNVAEMPDQSPAVEKRIQEIQNSISPDSKKTAKSLKNAYPWTHALVGALLWVQMRAAELTHELNRHGFNGGFSELPILLNGGIPGAGVARPNVPPTHFTPNAHTPNQGNGVFSGAAIPPRSFLDTQPNARVYEFEDHTFPTTAAVPNSSIISSDQGMMGLDQVQRFNHSGEPSQKRKRESGETEWKDDGTQDSTFVAASQQPGQPARKKGRPPASSIQITPRSDEEAEEAKRRAVATGNAYLQMQTENKRTGRHKPHATEIKSRKRWTIEETGTLINLITEFGVSWAQIKKFDEANGNFLTDRDQVNLKDKARNIKFDLLKSRQPLPRNFDLVTLSATMKNKLTIMDGGEVPPPENTEDVQATGEPGAIEAPIAPELRNPYRPPSLDEEEAAFEDAAKEQTAQ